MEFEERDDFQATPLPPKLDKRVLISTFKRRIKLILIISFIAILAAGVWAKVSVKTSWKARCFLIRYPKNMSTPSEMPYLYQTFDLNTVLETVRTREVLVEVIRRLHLNETPEDLFPSLDVQRGNRSNVLSLTAVHSNRAMSAKIANTLAEVFIEVNNKLQNASTLKIYHYYQKQREDKLKEIEDLQTQVDLFRTKNGIISISDETQLKFDQLKALELRRIENDMVITEMNTKITDLSDKIKKLPKQVMLSYVYKSTDETKLLQLQKELELLRSKYTDENPRVKKVIQQISELQRVIADPKGARDLPDETSWGPNGLTQAYELDKTRYEGALKASESQMTDYAKQISEVKGALNNLTEMQKYYFDLSRRLDLAKDVLRIIEGRIAESKMAMESNVSDFDILESAKAPAYPEGTKRKLIVVGVGVFFFIFGSILVLGHEFLDNTVKSDVDMKGFIKIPVIGMLPNDQQLGEEKFYANMQIITDYCLTNCRGKAPVFLTIGSDIPETGKTLITQEMIKLLQTQNLRVLYIDSIKTVASEIREFLINDTLIEPKIAPVFNNINPLLDKGYLYCNRDLFRTLITVDTVRAFRNHLTNYDVVIWELFEASYNIQLFSAIASISDLLVLVARFRHSQKVALKNIVEFLGEKNVQHIGGVINDIHKAYFYEQV